MLSEYLDVLLPMLIALIVVTLIVAPAGWRIMCRAFAFGLLILCAQLVLILTVPAAGQWFAGVTR